MTMTPSDPSPGSSPIYKIEALNEPPTDPAYGFGPHLMVDMYGCRAAPCDDPEVLRALCAIVTERIHMKMLGEPHTYKVGGEDITYAEDSGASAVVVFAESHFTAHGFPQKKFLTADTYSCRPFDHQMVLQILVEVFGTEDFDAYLVYRGRRFPRSG